MYSYPGICRPVHPPTQGEKWAHAKKSKFIRNQNALSAREWIMPQKQPSGHPLNITLEQQFCIIIQPSKQLFVEIEILKVLIPRRPSRAQKKKKKQCVSLTWKAVGAASSRPPIHESFGNTVPSA